MTSLLDLKAMERRELGFVPHRLAAAGTQVSRSPSELAKSHPQEAGREAC
ncbi:hypothetical protein [Bradyrhizobium japonicum]|nr:hypothetical protein [Bradyrhizobium japonicum]WLB24352.1 hypothetical protein QIH95_48375 [Bradyrhizobium japonicum]